VLDADAALAAGLVSSLHPADELLAAAHAIADRIAANDPRATQLTKQVFAAPRDRTRRRSRGAGRAVREPGEAAAHDRVPRERGRSDAGVPERVGVLGGAAWGGDRPRRSCSPEPEVVVVERDAELADAAGARVRDSIAASVARGTTDPERR
jgi:hypothetical protein